ncbi:MAG: DNA/RNA nuclease SfsA [Pseudomonadales bacterium]|nr:DNA/RNA nuclease SfsA [Pseudomonadales bacterium]
MTEILFTPPLVAGILVRRYKRFLAEIRMGDRTITAHCANTGAMLGCSSPGSRVWCSTHARSSRKHVHSLELVEAEGHRICVNTHQANRLVKKALQEGRIPELVSHAGSWSAEVAIPGGSGRFDFGIANTFVEVKSVTLLRDGCGRFPDARTVRGERHARALARLAGQGSRCVLLFLAMHDGIQSVRLASTIDPFYSDAVSLAMQCGVEVLCYQVEVGRERLALGTRVPFSALG